MDFISDIPTILQWYLPITALGILFLPLTVRLFSAYYDRGYIFSKIIGILVIGYTVWLAASLRILPFTLNTILIAIGVWAVANSIMFKKTGYKLQIPSYKLLLFEELFFLGGILLWSYVRGHEPSIHGLEKFMDFGFINSILLTQHFPPQDMWLAPAHNLEKYTSGFFINYYYFGHYLTALLTKLTQLPSAVTYNLMLSTIFSFCLGGSFSIGFNLFSANKKKFNLFAPVVSGLLTAFLVTCAGNLHTIYVFTKGYENEHPVPFWQIMRLSNEINYWYPNATRFIPNTIHEFPSYSWVVADLHGHVLDIPFVLLMLALLLSFFIQQTTTVVQTNKYTRFMFPITFGFMTAVMYMTNAWDGLIYVGLSMLIITMVQLVNQSKSAGQSIARALVSSLLPIIAMLVSFAAFSFPFNRHFVPFVSGVGVVGGYELAQSLGIISDTASDTPTAGTSSVITVGPLLLEKGNNVSSPFWMLGVLWGFFWFNSIIVCALVYTKLKKSTMRLFTFDTLRDISPSHLFLMALILVSCGLIVVPELLYAKDIYPGHYRANTMFKLGYQAFIMFSIVSGYTIVLLRKYLIEIKASGKNLVFRITQVVFFIDLLLLILVCIYPYFAVEAYYGVFKDSKQGGRPYEGIDGTEWLTIYHPDDYEAILWLKSQHTSDMPAPVVLEAVGESYTDYARISSHTGFPTVLGWPVHEWLWRGSYDEPGTRVEQVRQIYEGANRAAVETLLENFNVTYIVIGELEREKYTNLNEELLITLGDKVFESGTTAIYKIN